MKGVMSIFRVAIELLLTVSFLIFNVHSTEKISSTLGRKIVFDLQNSNEEATTTSCRKEQKTVIDQDFWQETLKKLAKGRKGFLVKTVHPIELQSRDEFPVGGKNGTFTFYGEGIKFMNEGVATKLRLRSRFYLQLFKDEQGGLKVVRGPKTQDKSFLEVKIKAPSPLQMNAVNKYRIVIGDDDLLKLFQANPMKTQEFDLLIEQIKKNAHARPENKKEEKLIDTLMDKISLLAKSHPKFIQPQFAVSYERQGFSYKEKNYYQSFYRRNKLSESQKEAEYQFTVDQNIRAYIPEKTLLPKLKSEGFANYFQLNLEKDKGNDFIAAYPQKALALEFKDPFPMANFSLSDKSPIHKFIYRNMVFPMHLPGTIIAGFYKNKGKAAHFKNLFNEEYQLAEKEVATPFSSFLPDQPDQQVEQGGKKIGMIPYNHHAISKLVIEMGDQFLFVVKKTMNEAEKRNGKLEFFGGRLEEGETPFEGLMRELREEESSQSIARAFLAHWQEHPLEKVPTLHKKIEDIHVFHLPMTSDQAPFIDHLIKNQNYHENSENSGMILLKRSEVREMLRVFPKKFTNKTREILIQVLKLDHQPGGLLKQ